MDLFQLWYEFCLGSIRVQIKNIGFSRRVGRPRTDYRGADNEHSAWKVMIPWPNIKVYRVIRLPFRHLLILAAHSTHSLYLPTPPTEQHTQLSFPVHKLVIPAIAFSIPIVLIPPPPPSSLRRCPLNSI